MPCFTRSVLLVFLPCTVTDRLLHWLQLQLAFSCFTDRTERYDEREDDVVWIMRQRTSLQGLLHGLHGEFLCMI